MEQNNNLLYERIISTPTLDGIDRVLELMDSDTVQFLFDLMTEEIDDEFDYENYNSSRSLNSNRTLERIEAEIFERALNESFNNEPSLEKKEDIWLDSSNKSVKATKENILETCYICVVNYTEEEMITELDCKHNCHTQCLNEWVKYKTECPICRSELKTCVVKTCSI
jgi:hypothetical protein